MELKFWPTIIFRETPKVTFFDLGIESTNGCNVVMNTGEATSSLDEFEYEQYYLHNHQIDYNLVIACGWKFILINPIWDEPHYVIYLKRSMGALEIPIWTYHGTISGKEWGIVLNQPIRDKFFDLKKEFILQKLNKLSFIKARKSPPYIGFGKNNQIRKLIFNPLIKKL